MKNQFVRWSALACLTLGLSPGVSYAQTQPAACAGTTGVVNGHANWDWETPINSADYGKTWSAYTYASGVNGQVVVMGAPWNTSSDLRIAQIAYNRDYTRQKGWNLVRVNFGCPAAEAYPNFVLYNKFTGTLRVFVYLENMGTNNKGALVSLKQQNVSGNGRITAATSGVRRYIKAPDFYLSNSVDGDNEVVSMLNPSTGSVKWTYVDFSLMFDPNAGNSSFTGNNLLVEVHGVQESNIQLSGSFSFATDAVGFSGNSRTITTNTSTGTAVKEFTTTGQKVVGQVTNVATSGKKMLDEVHTSALGVALSTYKAATGPPKANGQATFAKRLHSTASLISDVTDPSTNVGKTLKTVLQAAGTANAVLGFLGTVAGILWPDDDTTSPKATPFTPTVSKGDITMSGTIKTTVPQNTVRIQQPGTQHNNSAATILPYYDCGVGVFNISNTPLLQQSFESVAIIDRDWYEPADPNTPQNPNSGSDQLYAGMTVHRVANNLNPVYNGKAGLTPLTVEGAIVLRGNYYFYVPDYRGLMTVSGLEAALQEPVTGTYGNGTTGGYVNNARNPLLEQLEGGFLSFNRQEGDTLELQTPYVPVSCLSGITCYAPSSFKAFVRVKATFKRDDDPNGPPVYFIYDYAVKTTGNQGMPHLYATDLADEAIDSRTISAGGPISKAYSTVQISNSTVNSGTNTAYIRTGQEVAMLAEFGVAAGNEFYATTEFRSTSCSGANSSPALAISNCEANPNTWWRPGTDQATVGTLATESRAGLELYPNPTTGAFSLDPHLKEQEQFDVIIRNYMGLPVYQKRLVYADKALLLRDAKLKPGIYVVEVLSEKGGKQTTRLKVE